MEKNKVDETFYAKLVQKEMKALLQARKRGKISKILAQFQGLKQITGIKQNGKRTAISSVYDAAGKEVSDRQGIADVFAIFTNNFIENLMFQQRLLLLFWMREWRKLWRCLPEK